MIFNPNQDELLELKDRVGRADLVTDTNYVHPYLMFRYSDVFYIKIFRYILYPDIQIYLQHLTNILNVTGFSI